MVKKIYIIEAKLSPEKIKYLTEILDRKPKDYKRVPACTIADYIVTELKSPSRIVRIAKKSTCPVVHISWLFERSLQSMKPLDVKDYLIDVTEERKKVPHRVDVNALPQQLTWEEVADRRLNRSNQFFAKKEKLVKNSALQERNLFMKSYGGRYKIGSTEYPQPNYNLSLNRTATSSNSNSKDSMNLLKSEEDACSSSLPLFRSSSDKSSINIKTETDPEARFPLVSKGINTSSSSLIAPAISKDKTVERKLLVQGNSHTMNSIKGAITTKSEEVKDHHDFSIVCSAKSSSYRSQTCSFEEATDNNTVDVSNSAQDNSFNSISSIDSQLSISKLLSL